MDSTMAKLKRENPQLAKNIEAQKEAQNKISEALKKAGY